MMASIFVLRLQAGYVITDIYMYCCMDNASQPVVTNETNELDAQTCNGLAKRDNIYQLTPSQTPL